MPDAYYNDSDPSAAEWTRNLIAAGLVPHGEVDERSIREVRPEDVAGPGQRHFFAGIAGWAYACRLAGIPDDASIWTGSCPCQSLSVAGRRKGHADDRHLWPAFFRLIAECRPAIIVGEQVGGADGREWLAGVRADLEDAGYACGAADLPACSVGAPHIRSRLFWSAVRLADAECGSVRGAGRGEDVGASGAVQGAVWERQRIRADLGPDAFSVADSEGIRRARRDGEPCRRPAIESERRDGSGVGHADRAGLAQWRGERGNARAECEAAERTDGGDTNPWRDAERIAYHDGKKRRAKSGLPLLVDGISGRVAVSRAGAETREISRVAAWRGFGNAVVPQVAAVFLRVVVKLATSSNA